MDKIGGKMVKKYCAFLLLSFFLALASGCETTKGAAAGSKADLEAARGGAASGWQALCSIDEWIKKNLW
ncbi:MAG: hypothetical protein PHI59_08260 [Candidatus Omnitrophica bacterium]|nr:hypothetical protein [Candidatus Omnitrophota bacterium]